MSNYPKALEEFLKGDGATYKETLDKLFATEAGKKILEGVGDNLDYIKIVDNNDKSMYCKSGHCGHYDDCKEGKSAIKINKEVIGDNPDYLAFVLLHEMGHGSQYNKCGFEYPGQGGEIVAEADCDSRAFSAYMQADLHKTSGGYDKVLGSLEQRGYDVKKLKALENVSNGNIENNAYDVFKEGYATKQSTVFNNKEPLPEDLLSRLREKIPDFKGNSFNDYFSFNGQIDPFEALKTDKTNEFESKIRSDVNQGKQDERLKYPKALEEFLKTVPKEFKGHFDKLAQTETGKRVIDSSKNVDKYFFHPDEKRKNEKDGQARIDDDNKIQVMMTKGYMNDVEKDSLLFAYLLMHELGHVEQMENIAKAKGVPLSKESVFSQDEKEKARNLRRECDADRKALDMVDEAGIDKNTLQFKQVEDFLKNKYGKDFNINHSYEDMSQGYAKYSDQQSKLIKEEGYDNKLVKKIVASGECTKEQVDNFINGQKENAQQFINDKDVQGYSNMMLKGECSSSIEKSVDYEALKLDEKALENRKAGLSSRRSLLQNRFDNKSNDRVTTINPKAQSGRE